MARDDAATREGLYAAQARDELTDRIAAAVARVVDDIRHKVVEEPWFGREVTDTIALVQGTIEQERDPSLDVARFYGLDREERDEQREVEAAQVPEPDLEPEMDMER